MSGSSTTKLYFNYPSNAKIRIKKTNCYYSDDYPAVYRIITEKLDFLIPKVAVIFSKNHVYIPNSIYTEKLNQYYSSITTKII